MRACPEITNFKTETNMKQLPHIILETANFHGGDIAQLKQAIDTFSQLDYPDMGIKFHAFKPENVVLPDFSWYPVVKNFFIEEKGWAELIRLSKERGLDVWLDLFCVYGVEILERNIDCVRGIKLQPSILDNLEITEALEKLKLRGKELVINISGLEISEIEDYLTRFRNYNFKKIILQMGFQDYPTRIEDSSLKEIDILKASFPGLELSYADHISGEDGFAVNFSVYAYLKGCSYIEKHICNNRKVTEYDVSAALEYKEMEALSREIQKVYQCIDTGFITANERKYYDKSIQKPILKKGLNKGQLVAAQDILFRRTDKPGINLKELKSLQQNFFILDRELAGLDTLTFKDFKKTRIAAIAAARMKSSRLKQKAILPIRGMSSIERCLDNCLKFPFIDEVILATSILEEDAVLKEYTLQGRVRFWQGDPEDVISRYLGACEKYGIDVIIRVTGDCPVVSPEIAGFLLNAHFAAGADFTEPCRFAVGSNSQVYNVEALKRVIELVGKADYSEHMTLYMTNNPDIFKVNYVELPDELIRDYRLTLDYQEDLDMFNVLFKKLQEENLESTLVNVFKVLDENPHIPKINAHKALVYKTDKELIRLLNEKTTIKI
jgi:N,N'-diacetyllegionaminate synthase